MNKITNLILIILSLYGTVHAQNPAWSLAPNYISGNSPIPIPLPSTYPTAGFLSYYEGFYAEGSSNTIADEEGNLLFYVIDGLIYDAQGAFQDFTWYDNLSGLDYTYVNGSSQFCITNDDKFHGQETVVVRHPVNCRQYYIFGSIVTNNYFEIDPETGEPFGYLISSRPYYALFDLDAGTVIKRGQWFSDSPTYVSWVDTDEPIFTPASTSNPANNNGDPQVTSTLFFNQTTNNGCLGLGAGPLNADGSRFVCAFLNTHLYVVKIEADGDLVYWKRFTNFTTGMQFSTKRAEFEIVYDEANEKFVIAADIAWHSFSGSTVSSNTNILYAEFDEDMLTLNTQQLIQVPGDIHGFEFSPDLSKLYFSKVMNWGLPAFPSLWHVDIPNSYAVSPLFISSNNDLMFSFIERATDNNLYFASSQGLHRLTSPNTPNLSNFTTSPVITTPIHESHSGEYVTTSIQRSYTLPDQIDGTNYSDMLLSTTNCCLLNSPYDKFTYTATASSTWEPNIGGGSNPLTTSASNTVTIGQELRIPQGKTITIKNMILQFSPHARLVVENGTNGEQGGKLILDNTILTVDEGCSGTMLWKGVEVWGNAAATTQGSMMFSSSQGRLIVQNNSKIEHAEIGVLVGRRGEDPPIGGIPQYNGTYNNAYNGGFVHASNATFENNRYGVYIRPYTAVAYTNDNQNRFTFCDFTWNSNAKFTGGGIYQLYANNAGNIYVYGCNFLQNAPSHFSNAGTGIMAVNAQFFVSEKCSGIVPIGQQCPAENSTPTTFVDLRYGIRTSHSNALSYSTMNNVFTRCRYGVYTSGTKKERIFNNDFFIPESSTYQTNGIFLVGSTNYSVQSNLLMYDDNPSVDLANAQTYGVVVRNSGTASNEIYNNTFRAIKIGGQSELTNGGIPNGTAYKKVGLQWLCNKFNAPIQDYDLTVFGPIAPNQGYLFTSGSNDEEIKKTARNKFSLYSQTEPTDHDIMVNTATGYPFNYVHLSVPEHTPNFYTSSMVTLYGSTLSPTENMCPQKRYFVFET